MRLETLSFSLYLVISTSVTGCIADIRPDTLKKEPLEHAQLEASGRELLERTARAHGHRAWQEVGTYSVTLRDTWQGVLVKRQSPWGEPEVRVTLDYVAGTFEGRARLLSGDHAGEIWGMQAWTTYIIGPGEDRATFEHDEDIAFIVPAIQYLNEFVHRAGAATIVRDAGPVMLEGKRYERVFVTWEQLEPHMGADQYVLYIDPQTWLAAKLQYTVRDGFRLLQGTVHFEDYREVDGVWMAYWQSVTLSLEDDPSKDYVHLMEFEEVRIDAVDASVFEVRSGLGTSRDAKP